MAVNSENIPARRIVDAMPEAFVSNARISKEVHRRVASGQLRKLASRLYTSNLADPAEAVVRRNLWSIAAGYFPGAVVADRTALELEPASDGSVCLVSGQGTDIELPGIVLRVRRGAPAQEDDRPFMGQALHLSSPARTTSWVYGGWCRILPKCGVFPPPPGSSWISSAAATPL